MQETREGTIPFYVKYAALWYHIICFFISWIADRSSENDFSIEAGPGLSDLLICLSAGMISILWFELLKIFNGQKNTVRQH